VDHLHNITWNNGGKFGEILPGRRLPGISRVARLRKSCTDKPPTAHNPPAPNDLPQHKNIKTVTIIIIISYYNTIILKKLSFVCLSLCHGEVEMSRLHIIWKTRNDPQQKIIIIISALQTPKKGWASELSGCIPLVITLLITLL